MLTRKRHKKPTAFDQVVYVASIVYPLTALPQIVKVFARHSAVDLSIYSWVLYLVLEGILLIYAIKMRLTPIIIQDAMWMGVYATLVVGIILYG